MMRGCLSESLFTQWCKLMDENAAIHQRILSIREQLDEEKRLYDHTASRIQKFWDYARGPQTTTGSVNEQINAVKGGVSTSSDTISSDDLQKSIDMFGQIQKLRRDEQ